MPDYPNWLNDYKQKVAGTENTETIENPDENQKKIRSQLSELRELYSKPKKETDTVDYGPFDKETVEKHPQARQNFKEWQEEQMTARQDSPRQTIDPDKAAWKDENEVNKGIVTPGPDLEGFWKEQWNRMQRSGWNFNQWLADAPDLINRIAVQAVNSSPPLKAIQSAGKLMEGAGLKEAGENWKNFKFEATDLRSDNIKEITDKNIHELTEKIAEINPEHEKGILESAKEGDWETFIRNLAGGVSDSFAPSLAMMISGGTMSAPGMIASGVPVFGAAKYREMEENAPDMSENLKVMAAAINGSLEGIFETFLGSGAVGKAFRKILTKGGTKQAKGILNKGIRQGFADIIAKNPWIAPFGEGLEEFGTEITQNFVDKYSGYRPDANLLENSVDAFLIGTAAGASHSAPLYAAKGLVGGGNTAEQTDTEQQPTDPDQPIDPEGKTSTIDPQQQFEAQVQDEVQYLTNIETENVQRVMVERENEEIPYYIVSGQATDPDGLLLVKRSPEAETEEIKADQIVGNPVTMSQEDYIQERMQEFQAEQEAKKQFEANTIVLNGERYTPSQGEKGEVILQPITEEGVEDGRPIEYTQEQFDELVAEEQAAREAAGEQPTETGEGQQQVVDNQEGQKEGISGQPQPKPVITETIGKQKYDFTENEDGTLDLVIPENKEPEKLLNQLEKEFKDNPDWQVIAEKEVVEVPPESRFQRPTQREIIKKIQIAPKNEQNVSEATRQDNKTSEVDPELKQQVESETQPSYQYRGQEIDRETAQGLIEVAAMQENPEKLNDLVVNNDEQLTKLMQESFPEKKPSYKLGNRNLTPTQARAAILTAETPEELSRVKIQNDSQFDELLQQKQEEFNQAEQKEQEQRNREHDYLVSKLRTHNNLTEGLRKRSNTSQIVQKATQLGYTVKPGNKGKLIITNENGSEIQYTPDRTSSQEKNQHPTLQEYDNDFQQKIEIILSPAALTNVQLGDLRPAEVKQGVIDIQAGKKTVPANRLLDELENAYNNGVVEWKGDRITGERGPQMSFDEFVDFWQGSELSEQEQAAAEQIPEETADAILDDEGELTPEMWNELYNEYVNLEQNEQETGSVQETETSETTDVEPAEETGTETGEITSEVPENENIISGNEKKLTETESQTPEQQPTDEIPETQSEQNLQEISGTGEKSLPKRNWWEEYDVVNEITDFSGQKQQGEWIKIANAYFPLSEVQKYNSKDELLATKLKEGETQQQPADVQGNLTTEQEEQQLKKERTKGFGLDSEKLNIGEKTFFDLINENSENSNEAAYLFEYFRPLLSDIARINQQEGININDVIDTEQGGVENTEEVLDAMQIKGELDLNDRVGRISEILGNTAGFVENADTDMRNAVSKIIDEIFDNVNKIEQQTTEQEGVESAPQEQVKAKYDAELAELHKQQEQENLTTQQGQTPLEKSIEKAKDKKQPLPEKDKADTGEKEVPGVSTPLDGAKLTLNQTDGLNTVIYSTMGTTTPETGQRTGPDGQKVNYKRWTKEYEGGSAKTARRAFEKYAVDNNADIAEILAGRNPMRYGDLLVWLKQPQYKGAKDYLKISIEAYPDLQVGSKTPEQKPETPENKEESQPEEVEKEPVKKREEPEKFPKKETLAFENTEEGGRKLNEYLYKRAKELFPELPEDITHEKIKDIANENFYAKNPEGGKVSTTDLDKNLQSVFDYLTYTNELSKLKKEDFPYLEDFEFEKLTDPSISDEEKTPIKGKIDIVNQAAGKTHKSGISVKEYIDDLYEQGYQLIGLEFVADNKPSIELGKTNIEKNYALLKEALQPVPEQEEKLYIPKTPNEEREHGYRVEGGLIYHRKPVIENIKKGNETNLEFTNKEVPVGNWVIVEADNLQPAHIGQKRNPHHFISEAQPKERTDQVSELTSEKMADKLEPEKITNKTTNAYFGAPTVNTRGEVIQGNNRTSALKKYWDKFKDDPKNYKQYLINNAEQLGLNLDEISEFKKPMLVNMLDIPDETAIGLGQYTVNDLETGGKQTIDPVKAVRKLGEKLQRVIEILTTVDMQMGDMTLREAIRVNGKQALRFLYENKVINDTQLQSAFKNDNLTGDAIDNFHDIITHSLFAGKRADLNIYFEQLPHTIKMGIAKSIPGITMKDGLKEEVQDLIIAYKYWKNSPWGDMKNSVPAWSKNVDMLNPVPPEKEYGKVVVSLLDRLLRAETQKEIVNFFKEYKQLVKGGEGLQAAMYPAIGRAKAIEKLLNIPEDEQRRISEKLLPDQPREGAERPGDELAPGKPPGEGGRKPDQGRKEERGRSEDERKLELKKQKQPPEKPILPFEKKLKDAEKRVDIKDEERKVDVDSSEAQKKAGNYQKGHIKFAEFDITIENPKGSERSGTDSAGRKWKQTLNNTCGYFKRTQGKDDDQIDVFLGDNVNPEKIFVVDQINPETGEFDEHKVMLGFDDIDQAKQAYLSNYEEGWKGLGNIIETNVDNFKEWLGESTRKRKPFADYSKIKKEFPGKLVLPFEKKLEELQQKADVEKQPWEMTKDEFDSYVKEKEAEFRKERRQILNNARTAYQEKNPSWRQSDDYLNTYIQNATEGDVLKPFKDKMDAIQKAQSEFFGEKFENIDHKKQIQQAKESGKTIPDNVKAEYPELFEKKESGEYKYELTLRPFDIGTYPKEGFIRAEDVPGSKYGNIVMNRPLSIKEWNKWDLRPVTEIENLKGKEFIDEDGYYDRIELDWWANGAQAVMHPKDGSEPIKLDLTNKEIFENLESGYWTEKVPEPKPESKFLDDKVEQAGKKKPDVRFKKIEEKTPTRLTPNREELINSGLPDPDKITTREEVADYNARVEIMNRLYENDMLGEDFINDLEEQWVLEQIGEKRDFEEIVEEKLDELPEDFNEVVQPKYPAKSLQDLADKGVIDQMEQKESTEDYLDETDIPLNLSIEELAIQSKGITDYLGEAGYILQDGRMLDFSGKRVGAGGGERVEDHRQLGIPYNEDIQSPTDAMYAFMRTTGAIRIDYNGGAIDIEAEPTPAQRRLISKIIKDNPDTWSIDLQDGDRKLSLEGGPVQMALENIDRFYEDESLGTGYNDIIRYRKATPLYSPTEKALGSIQQKKGTPEQFKSMLLKNGAKQAELDWMGWDEHFSPVNELDYKFDNNNAEYFIRFSNNIEDDLIRGWSSWNFGGDGFDGTQQELFDYINDYQNENGGEVGISGFNIWVDNETKVTFENGAVYLNDYEIRELYPDYWVAVDRVNAPDGLSAHVLPENMNNTREALSLMQNRPTKYDGTGDGESFDVSESKIIYSGNIDGKEFHILEVGENKEKQPTNTITKANIQDWIDRNKVEIEEVQKGGVERRDLNIRRESDGTYSVVDSQNNIIKKGLSQSRADDYIDSYWDGQGDTKYQQYQLPGGFNYREWVMTMPVIGKGDVKSFEDWATEHFGDISDLSENQLHLARTQYDARREAGNKLETPVERVYKSSHWEEANPVAHMRIKDYNDIEGRKLLHAEEMQSDWAQGIKKEGTAEKWNREQLKVLSKEEASNYNIPENSWAVEATNEAGQQEQVFRILKSKAATKEDVINYIVENKPRKQGLPNMPFKQTPQWVNLVLRRMAIYAAENGYDGISWTPGEQQAERYDLSNQVDAVLIHKNENGNYNIHAEEKGTDAGIEVAQDVPEHKVEDYIGKDLAQKTINDLNEHKTPTKEEVRQEEIEQEREAKEKFSLDVPNIPELERIGTPEALDLAKRVSENTRRFLETTGDPFVKRYEGQDLKVGGEGMTSFYDKIVPNQANKIFKKFGAKVQQTTIDMNEGEINPEQANESVMKLPEDGKLDVMYIPVTSKLASIARSEGFPMFQTIDNIGVIQEVKKAISGKKNLDEKHNAVRDAVKRINQQTGNISEVRVFKTESDFVSDLRKQDWDNDFISDIENDLSEHVIPGIALSGKVHLLSEHISNYNDLVSVWLHETAHTVITREFAPSELRELRESISDEYIEKVLPKSDLELEPVQQGNELIAYTVEKSLKDHSLEDILSGEANIDELPLPLQFAVQRVTERFREYGNINNQERSGRDTDPLSRESREGSGREVRPGAEKQPETVRDGGIKQSESRFLDDVVTQARYKIIGEKGAANLDKAQEATVRLDNLQVARGMEAQELKPKWIIADARNVSDKTMQFPSKEEAQKYLDNNKAVEIDGERHRSEFFEVREVTPEKQIKLATGWEKGTDGKWRYETKDIELKIPLSEIVNLPKERGYRGYSEEIPIESVISDKELFEAYPELKNYKITFYERKRNDNTGGFADFKKKVIGIGIDKGKMAEQFQENVQPGDDRGRPGLLGKESPIFSHDKPSLESVLSHEIQHSIQRIEGFNPGGNINKVWDNLIENKLAEFKEKDWYQSASEGGKRQIAEDILAKELGFDTLKERAPEEAYLRVAGEVESRNVQSRMDMTPEQRREKLLEETEDVARKDQIFLQNAGIAESREAGPEKPTYQNLIDNLKENLEPFYGKGTSGEKTRQTKRREVVEQFIRENRDVLKQLKGVEIPASLNQINKAARTNTGLRNAIAKLEKAVDTRLNKLAKQKATDFIKQLKAIKTSKSEGGMTKATNFLQEGVDYRDAVVQITQMNNEQIDALRDQVDGFIDGETDIIEGLGFESEAIEKMVRADFVHNLIDTYGNLKDKKLQEVEKAIGIWKEDFSALKDKFKQFREKEMKRKQELQDNIFKETTGDPTLLEKKKFNTLITQKERTSEKKIGTYQEMQGTIASLTHAIWRGFNTGLLSRDFYKSNLYELYKAVDRGASKKAGMQYEMKTRIGEYVSDLWGSDKKFRDEMESEVEITLVRTEKDNKTGETKEQPRRVSIKTDNALHLWASWQSEANKPYMEKIEYQKETHKMTEETFSELSRKLSDNAKSFTNILSTDYFGRKEYYDAVNDVLTRKTGRNLPQLAGYIPVNANRYGNHIPYDVTNLGIYRSIVKERRYGLYDVDRNGMFRNALEYADKVSSFAHLSEPISDMAYTLNSRKVQGGLIAMGTNNKSQRIIDLLNKGYNRVRTDESAGGLWLLRRFVSTKILMNYNLLPKQLVSIVAMLDSDFGNPAAVANEFRRYMSGTSDKEVIGIAKELVKNHPDLKFRNIVDIESLTKKRKKDIHIHMFGTDKENIAKGMLATAMWNPTAVGDRIAITAGGVAVVTHNYKQALAYAKQQGMSKEDAKTYAAKAATDVLAEFIGTTQQSGKLTHKSALQYGNYRMVTHFMNSLMAYSRKVTRHARDANRDYVGGHKRRINSGEDPILAGAKALSDVSPWKLMSLFIYASLLPVLWETATTWGGNWERMWSDDDEEREKARWEMLFTATLGWTKGLFGIGFLLEYGADYALGKRYGQTQDNITPIFDDSFYLIKTVGKAIKLAVKYNDETIKERSEYEQELYRAIASAGVAAGGLSFGTPTVFLNRVLDVTEEQYKGDQLKKAARIYGLPERELKRVFNNEEYRSDAIANSAKKFKKEMTDKYDTDYEEYKEMRDSERAGIVSKILSKDKIITSKQKSMDYYEEEGNQAAADKLQKEIEELRQEIIDLNDKQ